MSNANVVSWAEAACLKIPNGHLLMLPPDDTETSTQRRVREKQALEVCWECPVLLLCRKVADRDRPARGVWGGLTESMRTSRSRRWRKAS